MMKTAELAKSVKWKKIGLWNTPFFQDHLITESTYDIRKTGYPFGFTAFLYIDGEAHITERDYNRFYDYHKKAYQEKGTTYFEWFSNRIKEHQKNVLEHSEKIKKKDLTNASDKELKKHFEKFISNVKPNMSLGYVIQPFDQLFKELMEETLSKYLESKEEFEKNNILAVLSHPKREATMVKERRDLLKIALGITKNKKLKAYFAKEPVKKIKAELAKNHKNVLIQLKKHEEKYSWMSNVNWHEPSSTTEDFIKNIKCLPHKDAAKEIKKIETERKNSEEEHEKLVKDISHQGIQIKDFSDWVQEFINLKMDNWEAVSISGNNCLTLFREIAKRIGLDLEEFFLLTHEEIIRLFEQRIKKEELHIEKPKRGVLRIENHIYILSRVEVENIKNLLKKHVREKNITGLLVFSGKVKGRVNRIMSVKEIKKMKNKDILVCPMTNPDYMPAITKAKAIVTDEGGLLCHAAIISREFKIPCVVGTKIATQILKDGDYVEIDAEKGIVKVIQKV